MKKFQNKKRANILRLPYLTIVYNIVLKKYIKAIDYNSEGTLYKRSIQYLQCIDVVLLEILLIVFIGLEETAQMARLEK